MNSRTQKTSSNLKTIQCVLLAMVFPVVGLAVGYANDLFAFVQTVETVQDDPFDGPTTPTPLQENEQPELPLPKSVLEQPETIDAPEEHSLDDTLRAHWVSLDADGNLKGRISTIPRGVKMAVPARNLIVYLIQNGKALKYVKTSSAGEFQMRGIEPGVYTLLASGDNGFLAYAINVVPALEEASLNDSDVRVGTNQPVASSLQIDAAAVPPEFTTLRQITSRHLPEEVDISRKPDTSVGLEEMFSVGKLTSDGFAFPLTKEGSLVGKVQPVASSDGSPTPLDELNVFLIQDDIEIAREPIDKNGDFEITQLDPGVYSIVVAGETGFAALSVQLVAPDVESEIDATGGLYTNLVATAQGPSTFSIGIIGDPQDLGFVKTLVTGPEDDPEEFAEEEGAPAGDPVLGEGVPVETIVEPGGFVPDGGTVVDGGATATAPQGSGVGPLAAAALAAGAGFAIGDSNNNNNSQAVSPSTTQ